MHAIAFVLALCSAAAQEKESDPFRSRRPEIREGLLKRGGGEGTGQAVCGALGWLARHQSAHGSWKTKDHAKSCKGDPCKPSAGGDENDLGNSALALLAFLGTGESHLSLEVIQDIPIGEVVRKGVKGLLELQTADGCIGSKDASKYMLHHALATLALVEAYGLSKADTLKERAQKAVDFLVAAQNPGKGWRYSQKCGDNDTSVTGWVVMALRAAELTQLTFPRAAYDGARAWLDEVTDPDTGRAGYTSRGFHRGLPMPNENFDFHETPTAMSVHARILIERKKSDPRLSGGCELLVKDLPKWEKNAIDFYHWFQASQALFQLAGAGGEKWKPWNGALKEALLKHQTAGDGCARGSWEPVDRWSYEGGRVYATAINALSLETYYRNVQIFGDN